MHHNATQRHVVQRNAMYCIGIFQTLSWTVAAKGVTICHTQKTNSGWSVIPLTHRKSLCCDVFVQLYGDRGTWKILCLTEAGGLLVSIVACLLDWGRGEEGATRVLCFLSIEACRSAGRRMIWPAVCSHGSPSIWTGKLDFSFMSILLPCARRIPLFILDTIWPMCITPVRPTTSTIPSLYEGAANSSPVWVPHGLNPALQLAMFRTTIP